MLSPLELSQYLSELPKNLSLKIGDKQYMVNDEFASSLSNYIAKKKSENPGVKTILIEHQDPINIFSLVASFLNGKKIKINFDNDYYLDEFASFLGIQSLKKLTENSLKSPLSANNIVQRISNIKESIPNDYCSFFEENVELIIQFHSNQTKDITENKIYTLEPSFLSNIIHSEKSRFLNDSSRYFFALNCYKSFYSRHGYSENLNLFINADDISKIPDDVIRQMATNEDYILLDGQFPSILLAQKLITDIINLQEELKATSLEYSSRETELKDIREEDERMMKQKSNSDKKLNEVGQRRYKLAKELLNSATNIDRKASSLSQFIVYKSAMDEITSNLSSLDQKCQNLKRILIKISVTKIIYADLRAKGFKLAEQFETLLNSLNNMMGMLIPNDDDINELIEEFRQVSKSLHTMADTLINLEGNE